MRKIYLGLLFLFFSATAFAQEEGSLISGVEIVTRVEAATPPNSTNSEDPPQNATTPTGNSSQVGITPGELSVSLSGASNYVIPIKVPPGVNGVVPQIGLSYNSQGGNGIAGYGWEISGISTITRIPSSKYHDNVIDPVDLDVLDRFALDGQRLVFKTGTTPSYTAGSYNYYETENFSNIKIFAYYATAASPAYFKVEYPDGSFAIYGDSGATSLNVWAIKYWQNAQGLRINYTYTLANNKLRISSINYGALSTNPGFNIIDFTYVTRSRPEQEYIAGTSIVTDQILTQINVKGYNNAQYRNYALDYYPADDLLYQKLKSVTEKASDNTTLNPTVFTYGGAPATNIDFFSVTTGVSMGTLNRYTSQNITGDFNGDGKMDMLAYLTTGSMARKQYIVSVDLSGTTIGSDHLYTAPSGTSAFKDIFPVTFLTGLTNHKLASQQGWAVIESDYTVKVCAYTPEGIAYQYSKTIANSYNTVLPGDFNGDGLSDMVCLTTAGGIARFYDLDKRLPQVMTAATATVAIDASSRYQVMDVNGDGKSDMIVINEGIIKIYTLGSSNTMELLLQYADANITYTGNRTVLFGDFNGDGKTDFIVPKGDSYQDWYKYTFTGTTFSKITQVYTGFFYAAGTLSADYITADYDNDGKTDILVLTHNNGHTVLRFYPNKNGTFSQATSIAQTGYFSGSTPQNLPIFLSSDKTNGNLEIAVVNNNGIHTFKCNKDFGNEKLLRTITTGDGVRETITYKSLEKSETNNLTNPNIYTPTSSTYAEIFPNVDVKQSFKWKVVSKLEKNSTGGKYSKQFYTYHGGTMNFEGLGFLGFKSMMHTNWFNDSQPLVSYIAKYDMGLRGANIANFSTINLWNVANDIPPSNFIEKELITYNMVGGVFEQPLQSNLVYKLKVTKNEKINKLKTVINIVETTYDIYNNAISVTENTKNGANVEKTVVGTMSYDNQISATPYYVGRITSKSTTTTTPSDPSPHVYVETYTYQNNLLSQVKQKSNASADVIEDIVTDPASGNVTKRTLSTIGLAARVTDFEYDVTKRFLTKSYDVEHLLTQYSYDADSGNLRDEINPYLQTKHHDYDSWGKRIKTTDFLGNQTFFDYSRLVEKTLLKTTSQSGTATEDTFDDLGLKVESKVKLVNGSWSYRSYLYDIYGRNYKRSEPYLNGETPLYNETKFDTYGRTIEEITYTGKTTTLSYTGLVTNTSDGTFTKSTTSNSLGQIVSVTDTPGGTILYQYYADGSVKSSDYNGAITTITKDDWGRKKTFDDPSAGISQYQYNNFGEITQQTNSSGTITYGVDDFGKVTSKTIVGAGLDTTNMLINYNYSNGILNSVTGSNVTTGEAYSAVYTYNAAKQLTKTVETNPEAIFQKEYVYDIYGRISKEYNKAQLDGKTSARWIKFNYQNGMPYEILDGGAGQNDLSGTVIKRINAVNARGQVTNSNTAVSSNMSILETYAYDSYGRATSRNFRATAGTYSSATPFLSLLTSFEQTRGNLSNRTYNTYDVVPNTSISLSEAFGYQYDRLESYPDENGTLVNQSYKVNGTIDTNNIGNYRYENAGKPFQNTHIKLANLTIQSYYTSRNPNTISYNAFRAPVTITEPNIEKVDFDYNIFQTRSVMYYGDTQSSKSSRPLRKYYSADGLMEIKKNMSTGVLEFITYIGGTGYTAPAVLKSDGVTAITEANYLYLYRDYLGSIVAITNPAGQVLERRLFDAWGAIKKFSNSSGTAAIPTTSNGMLLDRGYTGHEHLLGVGLIHMNARLYDPKLHRFLTPDNYVMNPYDTQDHNRYGYALNNPFMYTDPTGNTNDIGDEGYGNYNVAGADGNWLGDLFKSIAYSWDDPGFKEWRKGAFNWKVSDWMQNNFSWGSWFKNNLGAVTDWLGFGKEKLGFYYPASNYSFASNAGNSGMYASNSVSPMMGYNNGVEMHPFANQNAVHNVNAILKDLGINNPKDPAPPYYRSIQLLLTSPAIGGQYIKAGRPLLGSNRQLNIDNSQKTGRYAGRSVEAYTDVFAKFGERGNIVLYGASFDSWEKLVYNLVHELHHRHQVISGETDKWLNATNGSQISTWFIGEYDAHDFLIQQWNYFNPKNPLPLNEYEAGVNFYAPGYKLNKNKYK